MQGRRGRRAQRQRPEGAPCTAEFDADERVHVRAPDLRAGKPAIRPVSRRGSAGALCSPRHGREGACAVRASVAPYAREPALTAPARPALRCSYLPCAPRVTSEGTQPPRPTPTPA